MSPALSLFSEAGQNDQVKTRFARTELLAFRIYGRRAVMQKASVNLLYAVLVGAHTIFSLTVCVLSQRSNGIVTNGRKVRASRRQAKCKTLLKMVLRHSSRKLEQSTVLVSHHQQYCRTAKYFVRYQKVCVKMFTAYRE